MSSANDTPTFNLKAVIQETGLKPDTLRAWERRYGLPDPDRTPGGHRIYSQHDINTLKWLIARQEEGLSISRAVALWQQLESEGSDPLQEIALQEDGQPETVALAVGDTLEALRRSWVEACTQFDEQQAENVLAQAFALYPPEISCFELLQKGLAELGQRWYKGEISAQQEHFASALAMRRLDSLIAITPPPLRPSRVLIGCPPNEEHTFSPLLLTLLLRRRGWDIVYLGANVPLMRLAATIQQSEPQLVILSAQILVTAATLMTMAQQLLETNVMLAYGGRIFNLQPQIRARIPGHFLGESLRDAPAVVEHLLTSSPPLPAHTPPDAKYQAAVARFRASQAQIESTIWAKVKPEFITDVHLENANYNMSRNIIAALTLGDINLLGQDLHWVEGLLNNFHYQMTKETLLDYIRMYYEAARAVLSSEGEIVTNWLAQTLAEQKENK